MRLNEKFYTRTPHGLVQCDGKRINEDYAVIHGIPNNKKIYYVIHIKSGLSITMSGYKTIKEAVNNFESDLEYILGKIREHGGNPNEKIHKGINEFNDLMEKGKIYNKE